MLIESKILAAGISAVGMGIASIGIGLVFNAFINGVSRNPSLKNELFPLTILSFSLVEASGLFSFGMSFFLLYAF